MSQNTPLSILSLAPVKQVGQFAQAFQQTREVAQLADRLGYRRFWLAEHHNLPGVASSSTAVLIGYIASHTKTIRVGSGGIMLPNHAPLIVAETFGTLETLYPGRIDLGLGRAPGTDPITTRALRRDLKSTGQDFPELISELQGYFAPRTSGQQITAVPGAGIDVPLWILGSSLFSAAFAGDRGLPYVFAAHFAPALFDEALALYRHRFTPSDKLQQPYAVACVPVIAAEDDAKAQLIATSTKQKILGLISGKYPLSSPPPVENIERTWSLPQRQAVESFLREMIVGSPATVKLGLEALIQRTDVSEVMLHTDTHHHADTLNSFELVAQAWGL